MNRIERRCFVTSATAHAGLFATLAFLSFWAARHPPSVPTEPFMEMFAMPGMKLTDGTGAGGGSPPNVVPTPDRVVPPVAIPLPPSPQTPSHTRVPIAVAQEPKRVDPPAKNPPKAHPITVTTEVKSQETDDRPTTRQKNPKDAVHDKKPAKDIQVASIAKGPTAAELRDQRRREEEAAAAAAAAEQRRRTEAWQQSVGLIRSGLEKNLRPTTEITTPGVGGGGQAWMGYGAYLKSFYEARWKRPSSLPVPVAYVGVSITVARDGQLVRFEVIERSGIRALDDSVAEVLQRYRKLDPLPEGTTDPERVFRIKFKLEGVNS